MNGSADLALEREMNDQELALARDSRNAALADLKRLLEALANRIGRAQAEDDQGTGLDETARAVAANARAVADAFRALSAANADIQSLVCTGAVLARAANPGKEPARTYYLVPASPRLPDAHRRAAAIVLSEDIADAEQSGTVLRRVLATCSQRPEPAHYWQADIRRELSDADLVPWHA